MRKIGRILSRERSEGTDGALFGQGHRDENAGGQFSSGLRLIEQKHDLFAHLPVIEVKGVDRDLEFGGIAADEA